MEKCYFLFALYNTVVAEPRQIGNNLQNDLFVRDLLCSSFTACSMITSVYDVQLVLMIRHNIAATTISYYEMQSHTFI